MKVEPNMSENSGRNIFTF